MSPGLLAGRYTPCAGRHIFRCGLAAYSFMVWVCELRMMMCMQRCEGGKSFATSEQPGVSYLYSILLSQRFIIF